MILNQITTKMSEEEIPFQSGESNDEVVRVGETVRRSLTSNSQFVHKIMKQLMEKGFKFSPKLLGIDEKNREIISFIPGTQMNHGEITLTMMKQAMTALREFHDILSVNELSGDEETVVHTDFAPWNMIVNGEDLVGIIDFDDAIPGSRISDITYACWNFLEMGEEGGKFSDDEIFQILPQLISSYHVVETAGFVDSLLSEQNRILQKREQRVKEAPNKEEKSEREKICTDIKGQISWVEENRKHIEDSINS